MYEWHFIETFHQNLYKMRVENKEIPLLFERDLIPKIEQNLKKIELDGMTLGIFVMIASGCIKTLMQYRS